MNEKELLTITEYAQERGVSTQTIYQQIKKGLKKYVVVVEGKKYIHRKALEENGATNSQPTRNQVANQVAQPDITFYQQQIEEKDKQINALMEQLQSAQNQNSTLTDLLKREQDLRMAQQLLTTAEEENQEGNKKGIFGIFKRRKQKNS